MQITHKEKFLNFIGEAFIINLKSRTDRLNDSIVELNSIGITENVKRFYAIEKTENTRKSAEFACSLSHLSIINLAKENDLKNVLIFEDDICFKPDFLKICCRCFDFMQTIDDWNMFYLGYNQMSQTAKRMNDDIIKIDGCYMTHAYIVNSNFYDTLLNMDIGNEPIDTLYAKLKGEKYAVYPDIVSQRESYSDIIFTNVNYKPLIDSKLKKLIIES